MGESYQSNDSIYSMIRKILGWIIDIGVLLAQIAAKPSSSVVLDSGAEAIANGAATVSVVFTTVFATAPTVRVSIARPAGNDMIFANIDSGSITTTGFTAELSNTTPNGNYLLQWEAIE